VLHAEMMGCFKRFLRLKHPSIIRKVISIGTWKKTVLGNGKMKKDFVLKELFKKYQVDFDSMDRADAFALCVCYLLESDVKFKPVRLEVLNGSVV
jgi:hypothetical protein